MGRKELVSILFLTGKDEKRDMTPIKVVDLMLDVDIPEPSHTNTQDGAEAGWH